MEILERFKAEMERRSCFPPPIYRVHETAPFWKRSTSDSVIKKSKKKCGYINYSIVTEKDEVTKLNHARVSGPLLSLLADNNI